jgi:CBS domain-containing protein
MPQAQDQSQSWNPPSAVNSGSDPQGRHPDLIDPDLKLSQVMTVAPRTCSPMSMVLEAVMIFRDEDCGVVPITDAEIPVGVLTDRDVALALANHETDLAHVPVGELMSKDVVTIGLDDTLELAMEKLGDYRVRRLLVVDDGGVLQGILSWADLAPYLTPTALGRVVSRIVEDW